MYKALNIMVFSAFCLFWASPSLATRTCDQIKKPKLDVTINLTIPETTYDFSKTTDQLTSSRKEHIIEWLKKHGVRSTGIATHIGKHIKVGGLAAGGYSTVYGYRMEAKNVDRYGVYYCPYIRKIVIDLNYKTQIFIPKEKKQGSCEFKETMKHEWKHHTANVMAIKKYKQRLEKDLPVMVREIEHRIGYIPHGKVKEEFKNIQRSVKDAVEIYLDTIGKDSNRRNEAIDTPEEYLRVEHAIKACEKDRQKNK